MGNKVKGERKISNVGKNKKKGENIFFWGEERIFREGGNDFNVKYLPNYLNFFIF